MLTTVAEGVWIHESDFIKSHGVAVQGSAGVLLIDPGVTEREMFGIATDLHALGHPVVAGFSTHAHWDHLLWSAAFGDAPRYGTARSAVDIQAFLADPNWQGAIEGELPPEFDIPLDLLGKIVGLPAGSTEIPWAGPKVRIVEHRAHAAGHAALLVENRGILVVGDMLSEVLVPMLDFGAADPIEDYLSALHLLETLGESIDFFVPGHGSIGDADEFSTRIELDRAYLHALRDRQDVVDARIGPSAAPGWEWVSDVHAGQMRFVRNPS